MKISVVIPVFNAERFIQKSYDSIIGQSLNDFEIIYVDNNSIDGSVDKIKEIQNYDSRVKLMFQPKQGAASARNMGIKNTLGDYVYLFDVDDEIYPKALKTMLEVLESQPTIDAVFGKMVKSSKGIEETLKPNDESNKLVLKEPPHWGLIWFRDLSKVVGPPAFLYRASVFKDIGYYNEDISVNEDTAFDVKLGMLKNVAFLDRYIYLYFKHQTSIIQSTKRKIPRAFMIWPRLVKEHIPFYLNHDVPIYYERTLYAQIYQAMARQICQTQGFVNRQKLKKKLLEEVAVLKIANPIKVYLNFLVYFPYQIARKYYSHVVVAKVLSKYETSI